MEEVVPLDTTGGIEAHPILRSSDGMLVAFSDAKLLLDPSGEDDYGNETPIDDVSIHDDIVDDGRRSNGALLPDINKASSPGENASVNGGGVQSKEK